MKDLKEGLFDFLVQETGVKPVSCSCNTCKSMCKEGPCLGTPLDIVAIIEAGYADKLCLTEVRSLIPFGIPAHETIQPRYDKQKKACAFFTDEGLCELHDKGLKPTEGKLAGCEQGRHNNIKMLPAVAVGLTWFPVNSMVQEAFLKFLLVPEKTQ